ncbi:hypothetical protein MIDIC_60016 [Alphaproteobacteria bacterium]
MFSKKRTLYKEVDSRDKRRVFREISSTSRDNLVYIDRKWNTEISL